jgi:serine protease AprX
MRRFLLPIIAAGLLCGCGANDTFNPALAGNGGSFRLAAAPPQQNVVGGNSVNYTVTGTSTDPFNSPVTLSASGLPQGATATFNPNPFTPTTNGADSILTINTGGNLNGTIKSVKRGAGASRTTYIITITGSGGGVTASTTVQLDVSLNED